MAESNDNQVRTLVAMALGLTIASVSVILRFIARQMLKQRPFLDDWLMLAAVIFEWALSIAGIILVRNGLGRHLDNMGPSHVVTYLKVLYTGALLYAIIVVLIKISQLSLYHRLFPIRFMGPSCLVVGTSVVTWGLTTCIVGLFLCDPIQKAWLPGAPGQCLNRIQFYYGLQIFNIVTDVIIVVLPLRPVFSLCLTSKERVVLGGFFGLGTLVVAIDVVRLVALVQLDGNSGDFTWNQVSVSIWTCIEPAVAITTACLVHLRPVTLWMQYYWRPQPEPTSSPLDPNASRDSCVTVQESTAASDAEGGDMVALIGMRSTPRKLVLSTKTRSPSKISWTDRRLATRKAPSFGSMESMTHITSNDADLRTVPTELRPISRSIFPPTSHLTGYPPQREDPSRHEPSSFPDVLDLLEVHHTNDTRTATSPSTGSTVSADCIDGSDSALAETTGKTNRGS